MSNIGNIAKDFLGFGRPESSLAPVAPTPVASRGGSAITRSLNAVRGQSRGALAVSEIATFQPKDWNDSIAIAESFRTNTPVIVNLADLTALDQRRMVDFMLGLRHGLEGNIKRVTKTVFLLTPGAIAVNDEDEPDVTGMESSDDLDIRRPY
jgi:FtsZ-interacting cell division protein YlmF